MSQHHHTDYVDVISAKGPATLPGSLKGILIALTVIGFGTFAALLAMGQAKTAWIAYLHNFYFFTGLAAGGMVLAAVIQVARAMWGRPIKRFAEAYGAFLPLAFLLAIPLWFGFETLYEWAEWPTVAERNPESWASVEYAASHKVGWLTQPFVFGRVLFCMGLLALVSMRFRKISIRPDLGLAHSKNPDKWSQPDGWSNQEDETQKAQEAMSRWGVGYCFAFAFLISMLSYDLIMSLDYRWFSTMFGGWHFTSFMLIGWGTLYLFTAWAAGQYDIAKYFHKLIYHDLGKLAFGFTVVWGYLFFAQLMVIWYGNLSHEAGWLITRIHHEVWGTYGWTAAVMVFGIPFVLGLSKQAKMQPGKFGIVLIISILGIWLERWVQIAPSTWTFDRNTLTYADGVGTMLFMDALVGLGFLGLFGLCLFHGLSKVPMMPISDPRLDEGINRH